MSSPRKGSSKKDVVDQNQLLKQMATPDRSKDSDSESERKSSRKVTSRSASPKIGAWRTPLAFQDTDKVGSDLKKKVGLLDSASVPFFPPESKESKDLKDATLQKDMDENGSLKESFLKKSNIKKQNGPKVRVASFNTENQVARYKFKSGQPSCSNTFTRNDTAFSVHDSQQKKLSAAVINDCNADIMCLMEVENLTTIDYFNKAFQQHLGYRYTVLIEAHDPRFINVAVMSRYPIVHTRSHKDDLDQYGNYLLTRSCLEVDVDVKGIPLTLYLNHFRSMRGNDDGRLESSRRRAEQSERVREIVDTRWSSVNYHGNFIVLGDLNDKNDNLSSIRCLTRHPRLENVIERLPSHQQWTHHFNGENSYSQLDYLLVSRTLAELPENRSTVPVVVRTGLPQRAEKYTGPRHRTVGFERPKASDHCPIYIDQQQFVPLNHPMPYPFPRPQPQQYVEYKPWNVVPFKITPVSSRPQFLTLLKMMHNTLVDNNTNNSSNTNSAENSTTISTSNTISNNTSNNTNNTESSTRSNTISNNITASVPTNPIQPAITMVAKWNEAGLRAQATRASNNATNATNPDNNTNTNSTATNNTAITNNTSTNNTANNTAITNNTSTNSNTSNATLLDQLKQDISTTSQSQALTLKLLNSLQADSIKNCILTPLLTPSDMRKGLHPVPQLALSEFTLNGNLDNIVTVTEDLTRMGTVDASPAVSLGAMNSIHEISSSSNSTSNSNASGNVSGNTNVLRPSSRSQVSANDSDIDRSIKNNKIDNKIDNNIDNKIDSIKNNNNNNTDNNNTTSIEQHHTVSPLTFLKPLEIPLPSIGEQKPVYVTSNPTAMGNIANVHNTGTMFNIANTQRTRQYPMNAESIRGILTDAQPPRRRPRKKKIVAEVRTPDENMDEEEYLTDVGDDDEVQEQYERELDEYDHIDDEGNIKQGHLPSSTGPHAGGVSGAGAKIQEKMSPQTYTIAKLPPLKYNFSSGFNPASGPVQSNVVKQHVETQILEDKKKKKVDSELVSVAAAPSIDPSPIQAHAYIEYNSRQLLGQSAANLQFKQARTGDDTGEMQVLAGMESNSNPLVNPDEDDYIPAMAIDGKLKASPYMSGKPLRYPVLAEQAIYTSNVNNNDNTSMHGSDVVSTKDDWGVKSHAYSAGNSGYVQPDKGSWEKLQASITPQNELVPTQLKLIEEQKNLIEQQQRAINVMHASYVTQHNNNSNSLSACVYPQQRVHTRSECCIPTGISPMEEQTSLEANSGNKDNTTNTDITKSVTASPLAQQVIISHPDHICGDQVHPSEPSAIPLKSDASITGITGVQIVDGIVQLFPKITESSQNTHIIQPSLTGNSNNNVSTNNANINNSSLNNLTPSTDNTHEHTDKHETLIEDTRKKTPRHHVEGPKATKDKEAKENKQFQFDPELATEEELRDALDYAEMHPEANVPHNRIKIWRTELKKQEDKKPHKSPLLIAARGRGTNTKSPYMLAKDYDAITDDFRLNDMSTESDTDNDHPNKKELRKKKREQKRERFLERQAVIRSKSAKGKRGSQSSDSDE